MLLRMLAEIALSRGIAPQTLFEHETERFMTGEPLELRVPLTEFRAWLTRTAALTGEPALGLRCGLGSSESGFDLMAPLIAHLPTLRDAIRELSRFLPLVVHGAYLHVSERAGTVRLVWEMPRADEASDRMFAELVNAGLVRMVRGFQCAPSELHAVRFEHPRPSHYRAYAEVFGGAERFSQAFTGLELAAAALDRRGLHENPGLQRLVHARAEQWLERLVRPPRLLERLERYLANQPGLRVPEMTCAARALGVSARSLRRRLADEGLTYRELTQRLQCDRARSLLRDPELTPKAIADALGFADAAAFHRAFKRWTGLTASQYRGCGSITGASEA